MKENTEIYNLFFNENFSQTDIENLLNTHQGEQIYMNLHQIFFWLKSTKRHKFSNIDENMVVIENRLKEDLLNLNSRNRKNINEFVADVDHILVKNNILFSREYKLLVKSYDFALEDKKIIIELDGAYHFYTDEPSLCLVTNRVRNLFIILNGWRLLELNFIEWEKARLSNQMENLLLSKLDLFSKDEKFVLLCNE